MLTWDNGEGLVFTRTISIGDDYLFSVTQSVENRGTQPVSLFPFARVIRQDTPVVAGYWVFFEGMLGVATARCRRFHYSDAAAKPPKQVRIDSTGGWLGFTDKYWAAVAIPDQTRAVTTTYAHEKLGGRDVYQTNYVAREAMTVAPAPVPPTRTSSMPGPRWSASSTPSANATRSTL